MKLWSVPVEILAARLHGSMIRSYLCKNLDTNQTISCNERLLRKRIKPTQLEEEGNIIWSRRLQTYRAPPAHRLPSVASLLSDDRDKKGLKVRFNSVVEPAWSSYNSHHIRSSDFVKTFQ